MLFFVQYAKNQYILYQYFNVNFTRQFMNSIYFKSINQYTTEHVSITNDVKKRQLKKRNPVCLKRDVC